MDVCRYVHGRSRRHLIPYIKGLSHLLGMMCFSKILGNFSKCVRRHILFLITLTDSLVIFLIVGSRSNDLGVDVK
jgi:hypothetical protein